MEKFLDNIGCLIELNSGLETTDFDFEEFQALFEVSKEEAIHLISQTISFCKRYGHKTIFLEFVDYSEEEKELHSITLEGIFLVCLANPNNKHSKQILESSYENLIFAHLKYYVKSTKKKRAKHTNSNLQAEDVLEFKTKKFSSDVITPNFDIEDKSHFFYGKKVVITGNFSKFPIRNEMAKLLHSVGADVNTSISKKTDYVIIGTEAGWRKMEQIEQFGVETISEQEFLKLFDL
ncbi:MULTISPECIES: BRCT domain-containing protein [Capnocytophaga]|uniref:BRCT domain-containing protein n=1 Tax=Capnocytophaga TaxID=1016 RepID=UPI001AD072FB|nr:BRCT domain-containing protein [Capnocytophaga canis]GIM61117.1 hypothetical protein CAPN008_11670 [Capnocytophaga canis]